VNFFQASSPNGGFFKGVKVEDKTRYNRELSRVLKPGKRLLVVMHNNPDPDAMASAVALKYLAEKAFDCTATVAYSGMIGRAENRAMIKTLKLPLKKASRIRPEKYDLLAVVDTQPGAGNNILPPKKKYDLVIDHHPPRRGLKTAFQIIEPGIGATATLLIEWLLELELPIPSPLATALSYAIRSETQDLGREASDRDIRAYLQVLSRSSMRALARITHPKRSHDYFSALARALQRAEGYRNLICLHLGDIYSPDNVAQMADLLLLHKRISWTLVSGRYKDGLILSLRAASTRAKAGRLIKRMVPNSRDAGGHGMFAGGRIDLRGLEEGERAELESALSDKFARLFGHEKAEWKPLLEPEQQKRDVAE